MTRISADSAHRDEPIRDPSFMIIGAQKAATTWLSYILKKHPDVFIPDKKEIHFFNKRDNYGKGLDWYREHFKNSNGAGAIGDATPNYLWTSARPADLQESGRTSNVPKLVHEHYPNAKFIAILRDPVKRAISAFYHHIRDRAFSPGSNIMDVGDRRGTFSMGYYDEDLSNWFEYFPREQFKIIIFEEGIKKNKPETIKEVFAFLELDPKPLEDLEKRYNKTEGHLYIRLHYYFPRLAKVLKHTVPFLMRLDHPEIKVSEEDRKRLRELYAPHIERLEQLLGRTLPWQKQ